MAEKRLMKGDLVEPIFSGQVVVGIARGRIQISQPVAATKGGFMYGLDPERPMPRWLWGHALTPANDGDQFSFIFAVYETRSR